MNKNQSDSFKKLSTEPQKLLALYNALSGSNYPSDTPVEIMTFDRTNDIGLTINGKIFALFALRSVIDENILFEFMISLARFYEKFLGYRIYSKNLVKVPRPEFYVLYNGEDKMPETLKLSGPFALETKVVNINDEQFKDFGEFDEQE